jgi:hypothetical protein
MGAWVAARPRLHRWIGRRDNYQLRRPLGQRDELIDRLRAFQIRHATDEVKLNV